MVMLHSMIAQTFTKDCSKGSLNKKEAEEIRGSNKVSKLSGELIDMSQIIFAS